MLTPWPSAKHPVCGAAGGFARAGARAECHGGEFDFVEVDGKIVAFAQRDGNRIYYLQSLQPGAGSFLVMKLKEEFALDGLVADSVLNGSEGFWKKMGFEKDTNSSSRGLARYDWVWYSE